MAATTAQLSLTANIFFARAWLIPVLPLLRMYQRIFNGSLNERWRDLADLSHFEMATALPMLALLLIFGLYPALLLDVTTEAVTALVGSFVR